MRIAIYARKSTESEDRQVQSLEDQIKELKRLASREALQVAEIFTESKSAKAPHNRPEFERLTKAIEDGSITGLLTWSINRLSRNEIDGGTIAYLLRSGKLQFIRTPDRTYRPEDSALILAIENGMATAFLQDLSRNVRRGQKGRVERGWHPGKPPNGYKTDPESREVITDPDRFFVVRKAWEMLLTDQYCVSEIYKWVLEMGLTVRYRNKQSANPLCPSRLHVMFRDRFYMGQIRLCGQWYPGKHPKMVTEEEFFRAQSILARRSTGKKPAHKTFAFSRTFICARCGCAVVGEKRTKFYAGTNRTATYIYYHCSGSKGCSKRAIREEAILDVVAPMFLNLKMTRGTADWIRDALVESFERETCSTATDVSLLRQNQEQDETRMKRLNLMRVDGEVSNEDFNQLKNQILDRIASTRDQIARSLRLAGDLVHFIYMRLDVAVAAGQLQSLNEDPSVFGQLLRIAGIQTLNLNSFEFRLDSILTKIATFEPLRDSSEKPKRGDLLPLNSVWYLLVEDLRRLATDQIEKMEHIEAKRGPAGNRIRTRPDSAAVSPTADGAGWE